MTLDEFVNSERTNAIIGWVLLGVAAISGVESVLTGAVLWGGFSLFVVAVAALPALATDDWTAMVPWPLLSVAAVAVVARAVEVYPETAGNVAIAALALVAVVELDAFTSVELTRRFAVVFGVLTTMAAEALWIVAQFFSDRWLGTTFLTTQTELQEDIAIVTVVGFVVGGFFYWYFAKVDPPGTPDRSSNRARTR